MKLVKTKKVETITEEIDIADGIYYFCRLFKQENPYEFFRVVIENYNTKNNHVDLTVEKVRDSYQDHMISYFKDYRDYLGHIVECYFTKESFSDEEELTSITEECFFTAKERVKQKL